MIQRHYEITNLYGIRVAELSDHELATRLEVLISEAETSPQWDDMANLVARAEAMAVLSAEAARRSLIR